MCVRDGAFDFNSYQALGGPRVLTYAQMQEAEAVICVVGDNRHTFGVWYNKHLERERKHGTSKPVQDIFAEARGQGSIDVELVERELATTNEAYASATAMLHAHRLAVMQGDEAKILEPKIVDVLNQQIEGLKGARLSLATQLDAAGASEGPVPALRTSPVMDAHQTTTVKPVRRGAYQTTTVGPVQSGTLRREGE